MSTRSAFWIVQIAAWSAYGLSSYLSAMPTLLDIEKTPVFFIKLSSAGLGLGLSSLLYILYNRLTEQTRQIAPLVLVGLAASAAFGLLWHLAYRLALPPPHGGIEVIRAIEFLTDSLDYVLVMVAWSASYFGLRFWYYSRLQEQRALEARALAQEAQLQALSYQLNPHFLFNALNSVRALIQEDRSRAKDMVTQLSEFLRHALVNSGTKMTPLKNEIEALEKYLSIEKTRFEEKLSVSIDVDPAAEDYSFPAFLLHPLLENAIKHGMRTSGLPLRVSLTAQRKDGRLRIQVANTGKLTADRAEPARAPDTGIGLRNVRERLEQLYPGRHRLDLQQDGDWVRVSLEVMQPSGGNGG
jgi:two-component system LytT family sensor kinase